MVFLTLADAPASQLLNVSRNASWNSGAPDGRSWTTEYLLGVAVDAALEAFLVGRTPFASETTRWGVLDIEIHYYASDEIPPAHLVTSVRAVIITPDQVLVLREPSGAEHIIPGGRRRTGESLVETARREILEETCWTVGDLSVLAVSHFHIRSAVPPDYPYPSPDFLQLVYLTTPAEFHADRTIEDDWVRECEFVPVAAVGERPVPKPQQALLTIATMRRDGQARL